jgi:hypothetical protein
MNGPLRLTVLGAGHLGMTHTACMASTLVEVTLELTSCCCSPSRPSSGRTI